MTKVKTQRSEFIRLRLTPQERLIIIKLMLPTIPMYRNMYVDRYIFMQHIISLHWLLLKHLSNMKQQLLENFIRIRVTNADRAFIEQHILQSGLSISDLFRELILALKNSSHDSTSK